MSTRKMLTGAFLLMWFASGAAVYSQQYWANDVDVRSMDIPQVRADYSLWTLLSACGAKGANTKGKVLLEAYYINPITYVHLRGSQDGELKSPEQLKAELTEVFDSHSVIYVLLKTPDDEKLILSEDWKFQIRTLGKADYEPLKVEATTPELVFGYSGTFYETKILLFFNKFTAGSKRAFDVTQGDYLIGTNTARRIKDEAKWVAGTGASGSAAANPRAKLAFKIVVSLLFVFLVALIVITRPNKDWYRKKI
jgi:hypothetical protein